MPSFHPYNLLAVLGLAPQILTEAVWKLAAHRTRPLRPEAVHVITTAPGADYVDARLHGDGDRTHRHRPITHVADRWTPFCQDVFGEALPPPDVHVIRDGRGDFLEDVRSLSDAEHAAAEVYRHVFRLTREGEPPLVAVLAGGRKTLGADLQSAFSVWARPRDRLVHVLVRPHTLEYDPAFYYPTTDEAGVDLVEVPVPRLRRLLERSPELGPLVRQEDLHVLLRAIEPHNYKNAPTRVQVLLRVPEPGRCTLRFFSDEAEEDVHYLAPAPAATLVTLAEHLAERDGAPVSADDLLTDRANTQRGAVSHRAGGFGDDWKERSALSKAIGNLNDALAELPIAQDFLSVVGDASQKARRSDPVLYGWASPTPPDIEVVDAPEGNRALRDLEAWPFNHVPLIDPDDLLAP